MDFFLAVAPRHRRRPHIDQDDWPSLDFG